MRRCVFLYNYGVLRVPLHGLSAFNLKNLKTIVSIDFKYVKIIRLNNCL